MTSTPRLAYILATDTCATLRPVVARLLSQRDPSRLELIVVANRGGLAGIDAPELKAFGRVQGIEVESTVQMYAARAAGIRAATAPIVFIGETHSFPCEGWLDALLEALNGPFPILLPSITNACPKSLIGWATYLLDYSRLRPELPRGEVHSGLGHNTAYPTALLLALGDRLDLALDHYEERLLSDLQTEKPRIGFEPRVRLLHVGVTLFLPALEERVLLGLLTGASRARRWPMHRRLLYFLASPLIAGVLFVRELPGARTAIAAGQTSIAVLPVMLLLCLLKAVGEAWGYLFGCPAWTRAREAKLEIQRLRFARGFIS